MKHELMFIWQYVRRYWVRYILGIAALFIVDMFNAYIPQLTGQITDGLSSLSVSIDQVMHLILMILGLALIISVGRFGWRYCLFGASRSIENDIRKDLFRHMTTLSQRFFNNHKTGDLMAHYTNDLMSVRQLVGMAVISTFDATVMLFMVLFKMITVVDPRLTAAAIAPLIIILVGNLFYGKVLHDRFL